MLVFDERCSCKSASKECLHRLQRQNPKHTQTGTLISQKDNGHRESELSFTPAHPRDNNVLLTESGLERQEVKRFSSETSEKAFNG